MKTILVINDKSAEADHAVEFALEMARKAGADILLWNTFPKSAARELRIPVPYKSFAYSLADEHEINFLHPISPINYTEELVIGQVHTTSFSPDEIADFVVKKNIWMVIKGTKYMGADQSVFEDDNTQAILNKISCPLLLIPEHISLKGFEKIVYTADLRYCRLEIIRQLVQMGRPYGADILVAHIAAKGLPDIDEHYANEVFTNEISSNINYENLFFNHIREKNIPRAIDVMVDVMRTDLLVLVNHKFHFEEIVGHKFSGRLPEYLHVPLLVFPS